MTAEARREEDDDDETEEEGSGRLARESVGASLDGF